MTRHISNQYRLTDPAQRHCFDRALFDFLHRAFEREDAPTIRVHSHQEAGTVVREIECRCPQTAKALAQHIASALPEARA